MTTRRAAPVKEVGMTEIDPTEAHFTYVEKLRQLRQELARETDLARRHELLKQIDELEEELKGRSIKKL
jgi:hypothetical protein